MAFVLDDCEQLDITSEQAAALVTARLIYQPEPGSNPHYFTTPWDRTLDDVEAFLRGEAVGPGDLA